MNSEPAAINDVPSVEASAQNPSPPRKISVWLVLGIVVCPWLFAWFTLRKGTPPLLKGLAFIWLGIYVLALAAGDKNKPAPVVATVPVAQPVAVQIPSQPPVETAVRYPTQLETDIRTVELMEQSANNICRSYSGLMRGALDIAKVTGDRGQFREIWADAMKNGCR